MTFHTSECENRSKHNDDDQRRKQHWLTNLHRGAKHHLMWIQWLQQEAVGAESSKTVFHVDDRIVDNGAYCYNQSAHCHGGELEAQPTHQQ